MTKNKKQSPLLSVFLIRNVMIINHWYVNIHYSCENPCSSSKYCFKIFV